jgi:hypothetical protein
VIRAEHAAADHRPAVAQIADSYETQARREDVSSELNEFLGRGQAATEKAELLQKLDEPAGPAILSSDTSREFQLVLTRAATALRFCKRREGGKHK